MLAPDEPAPVELLNADANAPILLLCDHASRRVPRALGDLGLDATAFDRHIAWDIGALDVARHLADAFDAKLVAAGYSRLVVDVNRHPDHPSAMPAESEDTIVPANVGLAPEERARRVAALHTPYHELVAATIDALMAGGPAPVIISVHSFTPVYRAVVRPWQIGVLWNHDARLARPLIAALRARGGLCVGDNEPYSGRGGIGYTMQRHADARGLPQVSLEIRQDLIDTHHAAREWAEILREALAPLLADPAHRVVRHH
jgi:predicted N-formylglutamate amidohydrolase